MNWFKRYMIALRAWSFSASLTPVLLGSALAYNELNTLKSSHSFSFLILFLSLIVAICVHGAGNLVNTYYDYKNGIDDENTVADRTLVDKILTTQHITRLGVALYLIGSLAFFILLFVSPAREEVLSFIYFGGLSLSFMYTGGIGFKYMALGDLIILLTFGPVSVLFAYISQMGTNYDYDRLTSLFIRPLLYAIPLALNTEAILHSNNSRDLENDRKSGIVTLAIYLGFTGSYILYILLIFVPYFVFLVMGLRFNLNYLLPICTIKMAFNLEKDFRYNKLSNLPNKTAKLNLVFGLLYVLACVLSR
jgi:1,4-dihydroxy-2-naphthoate octaprenyltransferase